MRYRKYGVCDFETSIVGLGAMRLPIVDDDYNKIDETQAIKIIRYALDNGINYVDTAYPYHGGNSEVVVGKALKDGYRDKAILVDKCPVWHIEAHADFDKYLDEQLARLDTECIDVYLMHALNRKFWDNISKWDFKSFLDRAKKQGKIKHVGFSFHDDYDLFKEIVDDYQWDMCMIQQNIVDVDHQATAEGIKYAGSKGLAVVVMEPLKGGLLVTPPDEIVEEYQAHDKDRKPVEWALRWLSNYPEVKVVLSGMSTLDQLIENIEIGDRMVEDSVTDKEHLIYDKVRKLYDDRVVVKCTDCKYCIPCPSGVDIPENFKLLNRGSIYNTMKKCAQNYQQEFKAEARADKCTECGVCLSKCPQEIDIIGDLKQVHKRLSIDTEGEQYTWSS